jgi:hypothetical protein
MKPCQKSIGRDAAIALYESNWWADKEPREIAEFQMHHAELCMPFDKFHEAMEKTLERPIFTHEFGLDFDGLLAELMGDRAAPSFADVLALIPAEKLVVVAA